MLLTETLFNAYLKCENKFYLKSRGEVGSDLEFTSWQEKLYRRYKEEGIRKLCHAFHQNECFVGTPVAHELAKNKHRLIIDCLLRVDGMQSHIHALEKMNTGHSRKSTPYAPVRLVPSEKVTRHHKLLLAFDALTLSNYLGKEPLSGRIIHGSAHSTVKVKLPELTKILRSLLDKIGRHQLHLKPPDVILNKHCAECEFCSRCHEKAIEADDLSLLSGLSARERLKLRKKGIFTVTQLSYTFRPRRRSKRDASKPPRYYHSLKALAIREHKTFVAGRPQLDIAGTAVYLDVEGIPDQDFYYLIGFRFKKNGEFIQKSLWANDSTEERLIWCEFLEGLSQMDNPKLVHYGSYETKFLKRMQDRYSKPSKGQCVLNQIIENSLNLLSIIYAQIYFPTYTNGLKDIAQHLGFNWSPKKPSGRNVLLWRYEWEHTRARSLKRRIVVYNAQDCEALNRVADCVHQLRNVSIGLEGAPKNNVVHTGSMKRYSPYCLGKNEFPTAELEYINRCAYWDYQRDRVYVRTSKRLKHLSRKQNSNHTKKLAPNKVTECSPPRDCPRCKARKLSTYRKESKIVYDLKLTNTGIKRWIVKYLFRRYVCNRCGSTFLSQERDWTRSKYGSTLLSYVIYQTVELCHSQATVGRHINQLFGLNLPANSISGLKARRSQYYEGTYAALIKRIANGSLIHVDETKLNTKTKSGYVWVLTNLEDVAYIYNETREANMIQTVLKDFDGVLVSDFYSAYDSINCRQQKCLIHLIRDLNDDLHKEPFNEELRELIRYLGLLLRPMIETVGRYGLKKRYLRKHKKAVDRFYKMFLRGHYQTEVALKYKKRLAKYRDKLFTFLDHDDVPWNNNNAEHAIKAFARLRRVLNGSSTGKAVRDYLILLSMCETCRCKGVDFLEFLRSGQTDIDEFINVKYSRTR